MKFQIWNCSNDLGVVLYMPETRQLIRNYEFCDYSPIQKYSMSGLLWEESELAAGGGYIVEEFVLKKVGDRLLWESCNDS